MTPALSKITVCYSQLVVEPHLEKWIPQGSTMLSMIIAMDKFGGNC